MKKTFHDLISDRRSIRKFKPDPVPPEHLELIIEAARLAPSGTNRQPWRLALLTGQREKDKIKDFVRQDFVLSAPAVFVCCLDPVAFTRENVTKRMEELVRGGVISEEAARYIGELPLADRADEVVLSPFAYLDLGIAVQNMVLQAGALGLGSCWVGLFDREQVEKALALPERIKAVVLLPVGYPDEMPPPRPRLGRDEIMLF